MEDGFRDFWGWKLTIHELTDGNPLFEHEILTNWNWIQFLNEIAFRKDLDEYRNRNKKPF